MSIHPNGPQGPKPFPTARRQDLFPIKENDEVTMVPRALKLAVERAGKPPSHIAEMAVRELATLKDEKDVELGIGIAPDVLVNRAEAQYRDIVLRHSNLSRLIRLLERERELSKDSGISGVTEIFAIGEIYGVHDRSSDELDHLRQDLGAIEDDLYGPLDAETKKRSGGMRDRIRKAYRDLKGLTPDARLLSNDKNADERGGLSPYDALFGLVRHGDALRKFGSYREVSRQIAAAGAKERILQSMGALRLKAEGMQVTAAGVPKSASIEKILMLELREDLEAIAGRCLFSGTVTAKESLTPSQALEAVTMQLARTLEVMTGSMLRDSRDAVISHRRTLRQDLAMRLRDPRNNELAQLVQEREVGGLIDSYWKRGDTFLPVGEIADDLATLRELVLAPGGKVSRVILYGPPGTGKTEQLRQIAKDNNQKCRVISVHESSSFETLVGMHQLPLPRAESMRDAVEYWAEIGAMDDEALGKFVPSPILRQFVGTSDTEKAADYRAWYKMKFELAKTIAAIGAVSPDDPRVAKARQEALAAWLDQPLSEGLREGDIIVLDEIDKAGKGLEGVFDLLTRRPGGEFHPAGRTEPFRIHPDARVVATTNYGDAQTERSGGGDLPPAIVNRFPIKREVRFLGPETEMKLFEVMTTPPESPRTTLLSKQEYKMAKKIITYVLPRLREKYLKPGDLTFISPISVRTLEDICNYLVDKTTRTRAINREGNPRHFLEAAWDVLTMGPWKNEDKPKILDMIFTLFADSGVFDELNQSDAQPKHLVASRITGIDSNKTSAKIALVGLKNPIAKLPANFSLADEVYRSARAPAVALYEPLVFESSRLVVSDEEAAWRRSIEDEGGDPETQKMLGEATSAWMLERKGIPNALRAENKADLYMAADMDIINRHFGHIKVAPEDIQVFLDHLLEGAMSYRTPEEISRVGLVVNSMIQRHFGSLPEESRATARMRIDLTALSPLDWLGYGHEVGSVTFVGKAGRFAAREMRGGEIVVNEAGENFGYGMRGGSARADKVGERAFQRMTGGMGVVNEAGDRFGFALNGGTVAAKIAGERAANQAKSGTIFLGRAGVRLGEQSESGATIHVETPDMSIPGKQAKAKISVGPITWNY